jgi:hypothetical protein
MCNKTCIFDAAFLLTNELAMVYLHIDETMWNKARSFDDATFLTDEPSVIETAESATIVVVVVVVVKDKEEDKPQLSKICPNRFQYRRDVL